MKMAWNQPTPKAEHNETHMDGVMLFGWHIAERPCDRHK
jgi:hypothetical protein